MNRFRSWLLKRANNKGAQDGLEKSADGNFIVIRDGPGTSVRIKEDELESYAEYFKEKSEYYAKAYSDYLKRRQTNPFQG